MSVIKVLDNQTIDMIAAGEVVERPASIVKELVENAMDSGADAVTVEIRGGGIDLIRITDNGCGIAAEDIPVAFLRHATSKIREIRDLEDLHSMGFRGEALASIASVCKVTMITKCPDELMGHRYCINGGAAEELEEIGAPDGTTILAAHIFYNTPVRRKFLKSATGEANVITELMEHLALSRPDISYKYIVNGQTRFMTTGSGDLKEVIYRIYGRDTARDVVPISYDVEGIRIDGYLGAPSLNRPNRNFENYFLNRRYIRSDVIARGIEEGYSGYTMQHRFPFCVLHITMNSADIDVNVHPSKMDVRFHDRQGCFDHISRAVSDTLHAMEMIPETVLEKPENAPEEKPDAPEPFEATRREIPAPAAEAPAQPLRQPEDPKPAEETAAAGEDAQLPVTRENRDIFSVSFDEADEAKVVDFRADTAARTTREVKTPEPAAPVIPEDPYRNAKQLEMLPKERVISANARKQYRLIGSIFNTYWMFSYQEKLYFVDQHAAHEKVNYERLVRQYRAHEVFTQQLNPPIILTLTPSESEVLESWQRYFAELGFTVESFGGTEYAISTVPLDLYRKEPKALFMEILNELSLKGQRSTPDVIDRVLATMACKASVKGGDVISAQEMDAVLDELLSLENPYHCPHGRPTIFSMSRTELERKFKRIVN